MARQTSWPPAKERLLKQLYAAYQPPEKPPVAKFADLLGRTPAAVRAKARSMGLVAEPTEERICEVCWTSYMAAPGSKQVVCSTTCSGKKAGGAHRSKAGYRPDIGIKVRSRMEANYARYLNWLQEKSEIDHWEYEPQTFYFPIKRGTISYLPDFKVYYADGHHEWHETKGYLDKKSQTKLKRFAKYYPDEVLVLIDYPSYKELGKSVRDLIPNWEREK